MKPRIQEIGDKNLIGVKVVEIREAQGIKQKDLLTKLQVLGMDISATALSMLEGQHRSVKDIELQKIAKALGIKICDLVDDM